MAFTDSKGRVHKEIIVRPDEQPLFVFGYGSLLFPPGIEGRGIRHRYASEELIPCVINGYKRTMGGYYERHNFYGILPDEKSYCNGVLFQIHSKGDYRALMVSEGATRAAIQHGYHAYLPKVVTKSITGVNLPAEAKVVAVILEEDRSFQGIVSEWYIRLCEAGAKSWGDKFLQEFYATGGWRWDPKEYLKYRREQYDRLFGPRTGSAGRVRTIRKGKPAKKRRVEPRRRSSGRVRLSGK